MGIIKVTLNGYTREASLQSYIRVPQGFLHRKVRVLQGFRVFGFRV